MDFKRDEAKDVLQAPIGLVERNFGTSESTKIWMNSIGNLMPDTAPPMDQKATDNLPAVSNI